MLPIPSLGTLSSSLEDRATLLQRVLHDLAVSIAAAERTGQTQAAAMLKQQYAQRLAEYNGVRAQLEAKEGAPTIFSRIGDIQTAVGRSVTTVAQDLERFLGGVSNLPQAVNRTLPLIGLAAGAVLIVYVLGRRRQPQR